MQLSELREYASRMGWDPPAEYVEKASGKRGTKRPVQERLIADARLRRFDVVMVWKIDRMGRSFLELAGIIETLDQLGIRFVIPSQGIDTDKRSPMSRFVIGIFSLIAEFERATWQVRAGMYPGETEMLKHLSKQWLYTSEDYAADSEATKGENALRRAD